MKHDKRELYGALVFLLFVILIWGWAQGAGETIPCESSGGLEILPAGGRDCCTDRAILLKGIQGAHNALSRGDPPEAGRILRDAAKSVGETVE